LYGKIKMSELMIIGILANVIAYSAVGIIIMTRKGILK